MKTASKPDLWGKLGELVDRRRDGLYDRLLLKAGQPTPSCIVCFQRSIGPDVPWTETNMVEPGILPVYMDAIIHRFLFLFQPSCSDDDVAVFIRNYAWDFWVLQKALERQPVLVCAASGHMSNLIDDYGKVDCNGLVKPLGRPFSFRLGEQPIFIPPRCQFKLILTGTSMTPRHDLDFFPILDGTVDRPVQ